MTSKDSGTTRETIGNYDLLEKIADGSMGSVYKAQHWQTNQVVAIKVLSKDIAKNPVFLKRFEQEFRVANKIDHPSIVKVVEYSGSGERPFLVMEYVQGVSVGEKIERAGRIPELEALPIIVQVAQGLDWAHRRGMIHRDVKPDNILVTADGKVKLTDLGLAKEVDHSIDLTRTGRGLGTPNFMAPEQFRNAKNASIRCDIYSLAATLYQMVTGELPFGITDPVQCMRRKLHNDVAAPRSLVPDLSERVDQAILRAMSADPAQRPASCQEFVEELTGSRMGDDSDSGRDAAAQDIWYVIHSGSDGTLCTTSLDTNALRRALADNLLGEPGNVRASRSQSGPFELLHQFPSLRDLVQPQPAKPEAQASAGKPASPALSAPPSATNAASAPHFRIAPAETDTSLPDWLKTVLIVVLTVVVTLLAIQYLLPMLTTHLK